MKAFVLSLFLLALVGSAQTHQSDCFYFYNPASLVVYRIPSNSSLCTNSSFASMSLGNSSHRWRGSWKFDPERKTAKITATGYSSFTLDEAYATSLFDQKWTAFPSSESAPIFKCSVNPTQSKGTVDISFENNYKDPGPFAGTPRMIMIANPQDLIIEENNLGYVFMVYPFVVLIISICFTSSDLLRMPLVSVALQSGFLFVAICGALINLNYFIGFVVFVGGHGAAGLACFLVSRKEESQQFRIAQISTIVSIAISAPTISYISGGFVLINVIVLTVDYVNKSKMQLAMHPQQREKVLSAVGLNLVFVTYWFMTVIMFCRLPITAVARAYKNPFSMYPEGEYTVVLSLVTMCFFPCMSCMLNKQANLEKIVPRMPVYFQEHSQGLTSENYH